MNLKNTKNRYGLVAIILHWIVAFGFLGAYAAVYYRHWFSTGEFNPAELNSNMVSLFLHMSLGLSLGVFICLRIIWKIMNKIPDNLAGSKIEHFAARAMHSALYVFMIVMPITGYMGSKLDTNFFFLFDVPKFYDTALYALIVEQWLKMDWESFEPIVDFIHTSSGAYIVWILISLHAGAALYHHYIRKDMVLKRMLPEQK